VDGTRSRIRTAPDRVLDLLAERPVVDYAIAAGLVGLHLLLIKKAGVGDVLSWGGREIRREVFTTFIGFITFAGGFAVLAVSTYTAARGARVKMLRTEAGRELRRTLLAGLAGPVLSSLALICVIAADVADEDKVGLRFVAEGAIVFAVVRLGRLAYVLKVLITVNDRDTSDSSYTAPPAPAPAFPVGPEPRGAAAPRRTQPPGRAKTPARQVG
jgi:hypothetical protein